MKRLFALATLTAAAACAAPTPDPAPSDTAPAAPATPAVDARYTPVIPMPSRPLDRAAPLTRIAVGSCFKQEDAAGIWATIAADDPDLFLFIGDNVYGDVWSDDPAMPELRAAYRTLAQVPEFTAFREAVPMMTVWDDHDYGLNDAGATFRLRHGGEALFEEAWALPADDPRRARDGIYTAETVGPDGQRVQIILLDTRFFRSDLAPTDEKGAPGKERYIPSQDPSKTMLGAEQTAWLLEELQKPADLRLIVSSIQVIADGHGWEAWATLPLERQRLYDTIMAAGAENVILVSGDRHAGALYRAEAALPYPLYELTSSSLNAPASAWREESGETYVEPGPNRLGSMEYGPNFGVFDIDWDAETVAMTLKDGEGAVLQTAVIPFADLQFAD